MNLSEKIKSPLYHRFVNWLYKKADYTSAPIAETMIRTAITMLAATIALAGYNIVDTYFVGKLGKIPLAGMSLTFPLVMFIGCILRGFASGIMAITSQIIGAKKMDKAAKVTTAGFLLAGLVSIILAWLGVHSLDYVLRQIMNSSAEATPYAQKYMKIYYYGCFTATLGMCGNDMLIATGDSSRASSLMLFGLLLNVVLDPLFIWGIPNLLPAFGIGGAAIATVIAQLTGALLAIFFLWKHHHLIRFQWIPMKLLLAFWKKITLFAIPSSLGMLMIPIGSLILTRIINHFGDTVLAAIGTAQKIETMAFIFPMSLGMTLMPMVGQNYGAKLYSRIHQCRRFSMRFALVFLLCMAAVYFLTSKWLAVPFTENEDVRYYIAYSLRIVPWGYAFVEIHRYSTFFFTGCGHPVIAAFLNAYRIILLVVLAIVAQYLQSIFLIFLFNAVANIIAGLTGWGMVRHMTKHFPADGIKI